MFMRPKVSVTYNVRLKRARVQFQVSECLKSRRPPQDALDKAREKLEEELEDGHIEYYEIFEKKFSALWQHIRSHADVLPASKTIRFTLAQGARAYSEILLTRSKNPNSLAELSCQLSPRKAKTIFFNAFVFHIMRQLQNMGLQSRPDGAQLRFLYLLMKSGQTIQAWPLKAQPRALDHPQENILVDFDATHRFATLHIFDPGLLADESQCQKIVEDALALLAEANSARLNLTLLKDHTLEKLRSLTHKVQALGFGLPYSLLIAFDASYRLDTGVMHSEKKLAEEDSAKELPRWKMRLGALGTRQKSEFFDLQVDPLHMKATIKRVHPKAIAPIRAKIDADWLLHECHRQGVSFGFEEFLQPIVEVLQKGDDPSGMTIAEGQGAKAGHKAYLFEAWHTLAPSAEGSLSSLRDRQNTRLARVGQLMAEVRFDDGIPGRNIYGEELHALGSAQDAQIAAGEGVVLREGGRFYASRDGLIEIRGQTLAVLDTYVHEGSVNLSSGNLAFEGSVLIRGDIESGASVEVKGSLVVEGLIGNSQVKVKGNLEVKGGILTSAHGLVAVAGDCKALFIENSRIHVKGRLEIATSLLNSEVVCGKNIWIKDKAKGLISGGQVSCWDSIAVLNMGLGHGQRTICRLGTQYASELRWSRLGQRREAVTASRETLARTIQEAPTPSGRRAAEAEAQLAALQARLQKTDRLLAHIQRRLDFCEKQIVWNDQANLMVRGILDKNIAVQVAGKPLKIAQNFKAVLITAAPYRGNQINDLEIWEDFKKAHPSVQLADAS